MDRGEQTNRPRGEEVKIRCRARGTSQGPGSRTRSKTRGAPTLAIVRPSSKHLGVRRRGPEGSGTCPHRSAAPLWAILLSSCTAGEALEARTVRLVGSDTEVNAAQMLAEAYRQRHPDVVVSVAGGGSGAGIAALLDGRTDIANSSRALRPKERELAKARQLELENIILGIDALALIVHADNPIETLGLDALGRIYRGEVERWSEIGGPDRPVTLYGRQSNSGTYLFFRDAVVKDDYALGMRNLNGNAQVVESVRADPGGIGYVGVGYVAKTSGVVSDGISVLKVETTTGTVVHPSDQEDVEAGRYPISRPLFQYFAVPIRPRVADFLQFEISDAGQSIVRAEGFYRASANSRREHKRMLERQTQREPEP